MQEATHLPTARWASARNPWRHYGDPVRDIAGIGYSARIQGSCLANRPWIQSPLEEHAK